MSGPVATIVIPTFARPRQLQACLAALAKQTLVEPWEVVVVDDGSPQSLANVVSLWAGRLDLRVIRQDNAGPAAARNRGVEEARAHRGIWSAVGACLVRALSAGRQKRCHPLGDTFRGNLRVLSVGLYARLPGVKPHLPPQPCPPEKRKVMPG